MKYRILEATTREELEAMVNAHIAKSFKIAGGVAIGGSANKQIFYQAVCK